MTSIAVKGEGDALVQQDNGDSLDVDNVTGKERAARLARRGSRVGGTIDGAAFRHLENTVELLTETVKLGEMERDQLLAAIKAYQVTHKRQQRIIGSQAPRQNQFTQTTAAYVDPVATRPVSPIARNRSPMQRPISPAHRTISPSHHGRPISPAAFHRTTSTGFRQGSGEAMAMPPGVDLLEYWNTGYRQEGINRTEKQLLADNRAMLLMIDNLQRDQRKAESEYEGRMRRMQKTLTETTERCTSAQERVSLLEVQLKHVQKALRPGVRSEVMNSNFTRSVSSKYF